MIVLSSRVVGTLSSVPYFRHASESMISALPCSIKASSTACLAVQDPWMSFSTTAVTLLVRGGEAIAATPTGGPALDLKRVGIRLDALNSYGVVTALLMNAALRLYSGTPKTLSRENDKVEQIAQILFVISIGTSVIAGSYTTIVFSLLGLYSKSAIGLGLDAAFVEFFKLTYGIRQLAFTSFILSLISFEASFVLSLFLCYDGPIKWFSAVASAVAAVVSWNHWRSIMDIAAKFLFSG